ncbi:UDP-N-acetylglucosamine transferase subunit ALG14, partial [Diretmus argenteus]
MSAPVEPQPGGMLNNTQPGGMLNNTQPAHSVTHCFSHHPSRPSHIHVTAGNNARRHTPQLAVLAAAPPGCRDERCPPFSGAREDAGYARKQNGRQLTHPLSPCLWKECCVTSWFLIIVRIYIVVKTGSKCKPGAKGPVTALVIAGSGGHTTEILRLMTSLSSSYRPRHYVIADTDKMSEEKILTFESSKERTDSASKFTIHRIPRSREVHQSWSSSVVSTLNALRFSIPLVFTLRPDM